MGEKDITGQVVSELQKGSREAFDLIYCAYSLHVYNFLHAILFDKTLAADLTQDVFFKIWEKREGLVPGPRLRLIHLYYSAQPRVQGEPKEKGPGSIYCRGQED